MNEVLPMEFGRYRLTERLAVGGMAVLYRATLDGAHEFRKHLVIKRIQRDLAVDREFVTMFVDEAKLTARLQHPKIVQVFELGTLEDELFIAMELVEGIDLLEVLRIHARTSQPLAPHLAAHIAHEVLDALDYAHHATGEDGNPLNLVHRDISPGNVLISHRGDVKLADFGIAHAVTNQNKTTAGTLKGKYSYMAPEQVVSSEKVDARADVFAVGIVLSEMLIGRRLFTAASDLDILLMVRDADVSRLDEHGKNLDPRLLAIVRRALQRDRSKRYQTAREFRDAVEDWLFETHQRVAARDIAALVRDMLVSRSQSAVPFPPTDTLSGADTLRKQREAEEAADLGRARFEESTRQENDRFGRGGARDDFDDDHDDGYEAMQVEDPSQATTPELDFGEDFAALPALELAADDPVDLAVPMPPEPEGGLELSPSTADALELAEPGVGTQARARAAPVSQQDVPGLVDPRAFRVSQQMFAVVPAPAPPPDDPAGDLVLVELASPSRLPTEPVRVRFNRTSTPPQNVGAPPTQPEPPLAAASTATTSTDPTPSSPTGDGEPDGISNLSETAAIRLLYGLAAQNATGLLVASSASVEAEKRVYFVDGVPEYVESNVPDDLFGELLIARGKISRGEMAMAMAVLPHFGGKLGKTLVGLGLLTPQEALDALADQIRTKLEPLCAWSTGWFRWYRNRQIPREWQPLHIDLCAVMGAALRLIDEEVLLAWATRHAQHVLQRVETPRIPAERYGLGKRIQNVATLLGDGWTIEEIMRVCPPNARLDAVRILYLMTQTELATWR